MDLGITGRHVLVTGGSKGIGLACARAFLDEGARVTIVSRSRENLEKAASILGDVGLVAADLAHAAEAVRAVMEAEAVGGPVDILVNSAGSARRTPADDLSPDHYRAAMDAKFFSYVNVIDPVVKRMAERGAGVIVNVIGNGGKIASPIHIAGGAANAALMLATAGLANAYAGRGVRVLAVNPGLTETDRVAEGLAADAAAQGITVEEARRRGVSRIALGRYARPEEIADAVVFLASGRASYVSGVSITMDGVAVPTII
ncbi:SDR family oxidoreductase [Mesorhizobium sp. YIM 152430]|uniref:SDR family NAD(P)-dependent oxidoreductase n=1 Tax=Mesorhizobium sp. YIM 152430 TaxID=3031761 RepID=UPI0023DB3961|nr:SDR family oxidoreductase [Mesorhizobium sp. YIM 152430]MDF1599540.1 SDR family oxidoreductase [Mesorhizobium sp. YIM 152430]